MNNSGEYLFCPQCGGITKPGVCVNCGMTIHGGTASNQSSNSQYASSQPMYGQPSNSQSMYGQPANGQSASSQPVYGQPANSQSMYGQPSNGQSANSQSVYGQPISSQPVYGQPTNNQSMYGQNYNAQAQNYGQNTYGQSYNTYASTEPPQKKKSKWWIWLIIIGGILLLGGLIVAIIAVASAVLFPMFLVTNTTTTTPVSPQVQVSEIPDIDIPDVETPDIEVPSDGDYDWGITTDSGYTYYHRDLERFDYSNFDWENHAESAIFYSDTSDGSKDIFLASDYQSTFGTNHDNHSLDEFSGEYYDPFVDCIDAKQNYGLSRHFIQYSNVQDDLVISAYIAYIQLEGGTIPNEEEINRQILEITANDLFGQITGKNPSTAYDSVIFMVDSYVPYNDGEKMSILLDVNILEDNSSQPDTYIYGINIDLVNGEIIDNGSIIDADEDFAAVFREKCCIQNGYDIDALNSMTDAELAGFLGDENTNIVFYSPYGLEVGFMYEGIDGYYSSWGWATITLKDYEQYLK